MTVAKMKFEIRFLFVVSILAGVGAFLLLGWMTFLGVFCFVWSLELTNIMRRRSAALALGRTLPFSAQDLLHRALDREGRR